MNDALLLKRLRGQRIDGSDPNFNQCIAADRIESLQRHIEVLQQALRKTLEWIPAGLPEREESALLALAYPQAGKECE